MLDRSRGGITVFTEEESIMRFSASALALIAGLLLAGPVLAQGTGRSLDIQPGARENGMGGAGVALADDATGMTWWNPAGLGFAKRGGLQMTNAKLVPGLADDVAYNHLAYVQPMEGWGGLALSLAFLSYGTSQETDVSGTLLGEFDSYEASMGLSYGVELLPDLAIGTNVKYIHIQLAPDRLQGVATGLGIDMGGLYRIQPLRLRLGATIQNLGPSMVFMSEDQASPLSRNIKSGFAWEAFKGGGLTSTVAGDFNQSLVTSHFRTYHGGLEVKYSAEAIKGIGAIGLAGRFGYYYDPLGEIKNLTYGLGFNWESLTLDYGSVPQATTLPYVEKFSLGYRF
jgi:hypothetical protein